MSEYAEIKMSVFWWCFCTTIKINQICQLMFCILTSINFNIHPTDCS